MNKFLIAAALVASAGMAGAQPMTTQHLNTLDTNGDNAVSAAELDSYMASAFQAIDANGDGAITPEESAPAISPEVFGKADANGDGKLNAREFRAQAQADFTAADKNGDGALN